MRITKEQRRLLGMVMRDLERGLQYIDQPNVRVCSTKDRATCRTDYAREPIPQEMVRVLGCQPGTHGALQEVDKHIGSHIAGLWQARSLLAEILAEA